MTINEFVVLDEILKDPNTGTGKPVTTVVIDTEIKEILDSMVLDEGYSDYPEALKDIIFAGVFEAAKKIKTNDQEKGNHDD